MLHLEYILEDHIIEWITKYQFGMTLHGEQDGDSIHREFNKLEHTMAHVPNLQTRLLIVMKEHYTINYPLVQNCGTKIQKKLNHNAPTV